MKANGIDRVDTGVRSGSSKSEYSDDVLEALDDYGAEEIQDGQRSDFDLVVEIGDEEYGLNAEEADESIAALQSEFNDRGVEVYQTRKDRVSETADIRGNDEYSEEQVEDEAVSEELEPDTEHDDWRVRKALN